MKILLIVLLVVVALLVLNIVRIVMQNTTVPTLGHDNGQLKPLSKKPNAVSTQAADEERRVRTWPFKADLASTRAAILEAVKAYGGAEVVTEADDYIYVVFTTAKMHYHDDVEFYLDNEAQQVHFRSASRAGYSDLGLNRQRYEKLTELYGQ
ncbi:DUF1499 domain-containing protein [Saccharospirillum mangrovi]|uniref:DUF1499 domain-containing protein n=1 Tax=Saccharospirillum mangrovi TaxID=2161747 RepID=UPI001E46D71B|nr:DUF1499 domain-containing protein [Saccharospirillum mangrovi]